MRYSPHSSGSQEDRFKRAEHHAHIGCSIGTAIAAFCLLYFVVIRAGGRNRMGLLEFAVTTPGVLTMIGISAAIGFVYYIAKRGSRHADD